MSSYAYTKQPICAGRTLVAKTCLGCGQLKMAEHFSKSKRTTQARAYYEAACKSCSSAQSAGITTRINDELLLTAHNHHQIWSGAEIKRLEELDALGWKAKDIAKDIGRSLNSIYRMRTLLRKDKE